MTAPFELVIFDCDGVLVDSERLSLRLDIQYFERLGLQWSQTEIVERCVGLSEPDIRAGIERALGGPIPPEIDAEFEELYRKAFDEELEAVDGAAGVLEALAAAGVPVCVASSGWHEKIRRSLARTDLAHHFGERIFSATDVEHGKPAPDLFLHAASTQGAAPARCAVVEDSAHGVVAGLAAGMHTFAYAGGVTPAARLRAAGDRAVMFADMRELTGLLLQAQ